MSLTLRIPKGEKLTIKEMDDNLVYLESSSFSRVLNTDFNNFTSSFDTGSFTGSFVGLFSGSTTSYGTEGTILYNGQEEVKPASDLLYDNSSGYLGIKNSQPETGLDAKTAIISNISLNRRNIDTETILPPNSTGTLIGTIQVNSTLEIGLNSNIYITDLDTTSITVTLNLELTDTSTEYTFSDKYNKYFPTPEQNPVLHLRRGETYQLINIPLEDPLVIRLSDGGTLYNIGVSNNGGTGIVSFTVPMSAPNTLYYQSTVHPSMGNVINIT